MEIIPIQIRRQEVVIPLTYFPKFSQLELVVEEDVVVVRPRAARPELELDQNERRAAMLAETAVFQAQLEALRQTHLRQYVAFRQGELVDSDPDHRRLVERINAAYPDDLVLIRQVTAETESKRPLRLGSPRLAR